MSRSVRRAMASARFLLQGLAAPLLFPPVADGGQPTYPSKAVELVVVYAAGGSSDLITRYLTPFLQRKWGQPVNVVNKTGAGGATGTVAVLQTAPDGYSMGVFGDNNGYLLHAVQVDMPYKWEDLNHVALVAVQPLVFIVKGDSKYSSLKEVVEDIRKSPERFAYGSAGVAGPSMFTIAQLLDSQGIDPTKLKRVPFDGGRPVATAVAGGHVSMAAQYVGETQELIRGGQLKALGVVLPRRWPTLPDVPTFAELGYGGSEKVAGPFGIFGPARLPAEVVKRWEDTLAELTQDPQFLAGMEKVGAMPLYKNAKDFRAFVEGEYKASLAVAQKLGIRK